MYQGLRVELVPGETVPRDDLVAGLIAMQYARNDIDFHRGTFRVRGDIVDIFPAYEAEIAVRVEYFGDEIESVTEIDPLRGTVLRKLRRASIYPSTHYATTSETLQRAIAGIRQELKERLAEFRADNQELYAQRLEQRTRYDLEMMRELGYCSGIENYSRHLDGRKPGEPPFTLINYFPDDFLPHPPIQFPPSILQYVEGQVLRASHRRYIQQHLCTPHGAGRLDGRNITIPRRRGVA